MSGIGDQRRPAMDVGPSIRFKRTRSAPSTASLCGTALIVKPMRISGEEAVPAPRSTTVVQSIPGRERRLGKSIDSWIQLMPTPSYLTVHVLVVSTSPDTIDEISSLLEHVAESNVPYGLPTMDMAVHSVQSDKYDMKAEAKMKAQHPFDLVLLSEALLKSFSPVLTDTPLIVFSEMGTVIMDSALLAHMYGVHDTLAWPHSAVSLRSILHRWMPRTFWQSPLPSPTPSLHNSPRNSPCSSPCSSPRCSPASLRMMLNLPCMSPHSPPRKVLHACKEAPRVQPLLRFLLVTACKRSAATLVDYSAALGIIADVMSDAEWAIAALQRRATHYNLIIVEPDDMPGIGGYALCSWFRQNQSSLPAWQQCTSGTAPTEIVILSATPNPATCTAFGADRCLSKPLTPLCFARAIRCWILTREHYR